MALGRVIKPSRSAGIIEANDSPQISRIGEHHDLVQRQHLGAARISANITRLLRIEALAHIDSCATAPADGSSG
jgi:hypothetical protein